MRLNEKTEYMQGIGTNQTSKKYNLRGINLAQYSHIDKDEVNDLCRIFGLKEEEKNTKPSQIYKNVTIKIEHRLR